MHDIAAGLLHRAHCRLASCHSKRRRFIAPLLARLLVLWKSFVVAWFRQLFRSLPRCRFRKPVGGTCVGSSSLDSVHETRRDRAVSQDSASAALPVPQNSQSGMPYKTKMRPKRDWCSSCACAYIVVPRRLGSPSGTQRLLFCFLFSPTHTSDYFSGHLNYFVAIAL